MNSYIKKELFQFLLELQANNEREWFHQNKERFEQVLRTPMLALIEDFAPHLKRVSPAYRCIAKKVGGSLFRIHRDVRFSANKSPYKTHVGIHFRHKLAKDVHAPGFYLHLSPEECYFGAGIWRPPSPLLKQIRTYLSEHGVEWMRMKTSLSEAETLALGGDILKRPPRGFPSDHPLIEDLKRKDFIVDRELGFDEVMADDFLDRLEEYCHGAAPIMIFLSHALNLVW